MQALIDFDGWRKWKDLSSPSAKPGPRDAKPLPNGSPAIKNPKDPLMSGKQKKILGIMDGDLSSGGDSSSDKENESRSKGVVPG